ncbi:MAG: hypothetical protein ACK4ZM_00760 [bacterium]
MKILCFTNILAGLSVSIVEEDEEKFNNLFDFYISDGNQIKNIPFILETVKKVEKIENIDSIFVTTGPGYFTTIRITSLITQIISFLLKKELLFTDSFSALKNVFNFVYKNFNQKPISNEQIYLIKIASKRYRLKHNEIDLEITSLEEVTNLAKKGNIKIIFSHLNQREIEFFKKEKVDFVDLSNIYKAGMVYLSSKDDLKKSPDYNLKISY